MHKMLLPASLLLRVERPISTQAGVGKKLFHRKVRVETQPPQTQDVVMTPAALQPNTIEVRPRIGVAVLVTDDQGRLLLGQRGKSPNYGKWVVPGGGVKFGERWLEAATREIEEETGLLVQIYDATRPFVLEIVGEGEHRVILYVRGRVVSGKLKADTDLLDARFFGKNDIPRDEISPAVEPVLAEFGWL